MGVRPYREFGPGTQRVMEPSGKRFRRRAEGENQSGVDTDE